MKSFNLFVTLLMSLLLSALGGGKKSSGKKGSTRSVSFSGLYEGLDQFDGSVIKVAILCGQGGMGCSFTYVDASATICGGDTMTILGEEGMIDYDAEKLAFPDSFISCATDGVLDAASVVFSMDPVNNALISTVADRYTETFFKISN